MTEQGSLLEEEIESWEGFQRVMRHDDRALWDAMVQEVRERFGEAVEKSGTPLTTDPFFMALLLAQQRTIRFLINELKARGVVSDRLLADTNYASRQAQLD